MVEQSQDMMSRRLIEMSSQADAGSALKRQTRPASLRQNVNGASKLQKS